MNQCSHCWHYGSMKGITLRICEKCGQKDACFTDQVMLVWDDVDTGLTEYDPEDYEYSESELKTEPEDIDE